MNSQHRVVILGAGPPHLGEIPAALHETQKGTPVLQWLLNALKTEESAVIFVGGYQLQAIRERYPHLRIVENQDWRATGSGASLLAAPMQKGDSLIVAYSDILFRAETVAALENCDGPITVAWDSAWRHRYDHRSVADLERCEKIAIHNGSVVRLGSDLPLDWADGEFIGLVRFGPEAVERLLDLQARPVQSLRKVHLAGLIEYLRASGFSVGGVDVAGAWAEVNQPRDIAHFVLGTKAETLRRLRGVVKNAVIQDQVAFTVANWKTASGAILEQVRRQLHGHKLVVRSSARSEDSFSSANAGAYDSVLNVDPTVELEAAIASVIRSYGDPRDDDQILVQPMVTNVALSGVAFTRTLENAAPWCCINYETSGDTRAITSGCSGDHRTMLVRKVPLRSPVPDRRLDGLLKALEEIERLLGYDSLDIEFAVGTDGVCYVLQVRPIAVARTPDGVDDERCHRAVERAKETWRTLEKTPPHVPGSAAPIFGIMPDWNPAEIIGTAPARLAESLYRHLIMDEVWATQRAQYGYRDVRPAPLLVSFAGRPYVDVRLSFASFIPADVSTRVAGKLLDFYLEWLRAHPELHDKVEFEVVPTCMAPGFSFWATRLSKEAGLDGAEIEELSRGLTRVTRAGVERVHTDLAVIERLAARYKVLAKSELAPVERARLLLDECRALGTLPFAHLARGGFVAVTLLKQAEAAGVITARARASFLSTLTTVSGMLALDARAAAEGAMEWDSFVEKYGHLRPGSYDITSPRYDEAPERYLRPLVVHAHEAAADEPDPRPWLEEKPRFLESIGSLGILPDGLDIEPFLRAAIQGREYAKFVFTRNLSLALEDLARVGEGLGLGRAELAHVPVGELLELRDTPRNRDDASRHLKRLACEGKEWTAIARSVELPPLLTRASDFDAFVIGSDIPNFVGSHGTVSPAVLLNTAAGESAQVIEGNVVLIPQADPGYDWIFGHRISGLVTMYGGANSHMAIRAAEFDIPAAIGVGERRYQELSCARVIELDPPNRLVRLVR